MRVLMMLVMAGNLAAQAIPTINLSGIVRADTTRPGILPAGIIFSIWGHGYGPHEGCHGPATLVCGVQVLLDGAPIEVQYTNDVLINARMPDDAPAQAVSKLTVVSGGRRSEPVEVRRVPDVAVIALDGVARVNGTIWIHVALPGGLGASYPSMAVPWDFACSAFEVRRNGSILTPISHPGLGGAYSGPSCPGTVKGADTHSRLPLHLQYDLTEPGAYEVRLLQYGDFGRRPQDIRSQSDWTPIHLLPADGAPRTLGARPQEPAMIVREFLPDLLAKRDDVALSILIEYLYHASPRVRSYAANALYYWPQATIEARLLTALKANGPSPAMMTPLKDHPVETAQAAVDYLFSDDIVLFKGAIAAAAAAIQAVQSIDPTLRQSLEERLMAAATGNLGHGDAQTTNDLISLLGQIRTPRVHDLLWQLVARHVGTEQALIAIAWQKDPGDLPRLTDYLLAASTDEQDAQSLASIPYSMRNNFGEAAIPWLTTVLSKARTFTLRLRAAQELMRANDSAGFAYAEDALENNRTWKPKVRDIVIEQFAGTRDMPDAEMAQFLKTR